MPMWLSHTKNDTGACTQVLEEMENVFKVKSSRKYGSTPAKRPHPVVWAYGMAYSARPCSADAADVGCWTVTGKAVFTV